ncbi:MAG: hypothetical protein ACI9IL_000383 [Rickettsiales bacterium]|jgi:hypothetical protein
MNKNISKKTALKMGIGITEEEVERSWVNNRYPT